MTPAHVVLALMVTSSLDVTTIKKSTEVVLFSETTLDLGAPAKDVLKIKFTSQQVPKIKNCAYVDPCKAGYIQEEKEEERKKEVKPRKNFYANNFRRCHKDVNFYGKRK